MLVLEIKPENNEQRHRFSLIKEKVEFNRKLDIFFDERIRMDMGLTEVQYESLPYTTKESIMKLVRKQIAEYHIEHNTKFAHYYKNK